MPQQWLWLMMKEETPGLVYSPGNFITLLEHGYLKWNGQRNHGFWSYVFSQENDVGYFFIEFSATNKKPYRRHAFEQLDNDTCILLPAEHSTYKDETKWNSRQSLIHTNPPWRIFMQRIKVPAYVLIEQQNHNMQRQRID